MNDKTKLTAKQREEAVVTYLTSGYSLREVGNMYGVTKQNISALVNSKKRKENSLKAIEKLKIGRANLETR